jgi:hypothetical protein
MAATVLVTSGPVPVARFGCSVHALTFTLDAAGEVGGTPSSAFARPWICVGAYRSIVSVMVE